MWKFSRYWKRSEKLYKHFRTNLIEYLEKNPLIKYSEFKLKDTKYYYKNECNFEIHTNTFKNLYYNWRRESIIFKKYIIFIYNKTKNKKNFLKDYIYTYIYNKSGKTNFIHEHIIYISDYFIKKLRVSLHWYMIVHLLYLLLLNKCWLFYIGMKIVVKDILHFFV